MRARRARLRPLRLASSLIRSVRCFALAATLSVAAGAQPLPPEHPSGWIDKAPVESRRFMVAAANPLATRAGYDILREGGNAIDAAIGVQLVLGLVEPQSSGLGGGAFALYHDARSKKLVAYDGRETAPAAAKPDRFLDGDGKPLAFLDAVAGGSAVGVPGTVRLLETMHRAHGRLPWPRLFAAAIALAERGFPVSRRLHNEIALQPLWPQKRAHDYFHTADGAPLSEGALLRNAAYARTLRILATEGAHAVYDGPIADDIVRTVATAPRHPGDMTRADLSGYAAKVRTPVCGAYRDYRVCGVPLPSSGGTCVLQTLAMLEPYDVASMGPASFWSVHFTSEAERLTFADRGVYMADPAFYSPPPGLLNAKYLHERSLLITATRSLGIAEPGDPAHARAVTTAVAWGQDRAADLPSTSQISIVDADGNALSMTTTIEYAFGSRLMTEAGFLLNNELTDFSFVPHEHGKPVANRVEPGKRPRSSMAPTIAYDRAGRVAIVTGSPGSSAIIDYVVKTLLAVIDWNLDPQAAAALPNFGSRNGPTELEKDTDVAVLAPKLTALGHRVSVVEETSGAQTIARTPRGWIGGADPRREGVVLGD